MHKMHCLKWLLLEIYSLHFYHHIWAQGCLLENLQKSPEWSKWGFPTLISACQFKELNHLIFSNCFITTPKQTLSLAGSKVLTCTGRSHWNTTPYVWMCYLWSKVSCLLQTFQIHLQWNNKKTDIFDCSWPGWLRIFISTFIIHIIQRHSWNH